MTTREIQQLKEKISRLEADLQKEIRSRQDLVAYKNEIEAILDNAPAEERFIDIVNTLDGVVWEADIDSIGSVTFISEKVEQVLGFSVQECKHPDFWDDRIHPDDRLQVRQMSSKYHQQGKDAYQLEYRLISRAGDIVFVRDLVSVKKQNGKAYRLRGIIIDITGQKRAEIARGEAEARFRNMFLAAPVGMVLVDFDSFQALELNPAYCRIVDRSAEEMKHIGWQSIVHPQDLEKELVLLEKFRQGEIPGYSIEKRYFRRDGEVIWGLCRLCHIDTENCSQRQYLVMLEDITERKNYESRIWKQANYDFLTALPNRNMLVDRLGQLIKRESREGKEFAMLLIDLDGFKDVNDTKGHDKGDELLIEVSNRIQASLRGSDTVARVGGDEFIVIVPDLVNRHDVDKIAKNIIDAVARAYTIDSDPVYITSSIGITVFPEDGKDVITLIRNADQAMYAAKRLGRSRYQYFTEEMQFQAQHRMQLIAEMRRALREQQFVLYYQPIIDLNNAGIAKAEALLRWNHEARGLIRPQHFIPLAEETGLINDIGEQVFSQSIRHVKNWRNLFDTEFQVSLNVSPVQFQAADQIAGYLAPWQELDSLICLEITENILMSPGNAVVDLLLKCRDAGVQVALDDFGTGYSSLSYLRKFDIDFLKIDRSFVQNIEDNRDDLALCSAIVIMAHTLGIKVIAEGIETDRQRQLLVDIGCDYGQGYHFCKPLPADRFEAFVIENNLASAAG